MSRPSENRVRLVVHVHKETARIMRKIAKERGTLGKVVDWWAAGAGVWAFPVRAKKGKSANSKVSHSAGRTPESEGMK